MIFVKASRASRGYNLRERLFFSHNLTTIKNLSWTCKLVRYLLMGLRWTIIVSMQSLTVRSQSEVFSWTLPVTILNTQLWFLLIRNLVQ